MIRVNEVSNNSVPEMPTRDKRERRGEPCSGGGDKEPHEPEAWQSSDTLNQSQVHAEGVSRAMTTSFYGVVELEELHKRFPTRTATDA